VSGRTNSIGLFLLQTMELFNIEKNYSKGFRFKESELGVFSGNSDIAIRNLKKNKRIIGLSRGDFSLIDLIHSTLKKIGKAKVICCTWSAGIKDANQVQWMLNSGLIDSFTLVTDHSYVTRQRKYALAIEDLFGLENIRTSEIHAKFVLIQNDNWNISIRTSMNLNANKTCETFEIDDDIDIFNFYRNFVDETFKNTPTGFEQKSWVVNKALDKFFGENKEVVKQSFGFFKLGNE
jgi:hypothetical protein